MKSWIKFSFAVALLQLTAPAYAVDKTDANAVGTADKAKIEKIVHDYLLEKPEVLVEAIQRLQQKQIMEAEKTIKQTKQTAASFAAPLFHQANDPISGNPNGKITVVEFFDYQCPHCIDMVPVIEAALKTNPSIRVVYKEFPVRGPLSNFAARAALAANKQGKYLEFSHALLSAKQPFTQEMIFQIAKDKGLDVDKLKKDINDKNIDDQIKANMKLAQDLKLFGTPAIFVGKTDASNKNTIDYFPGKTTQGQLQGMIDKANQ